MPLSANGLCEAEIITPRSARIDRVSIATAGVGIGPEQHDVHADAGEAGDHRRFHHVAGQARVLADHHPVAVVAAQEVRARRLADAQRGLGRHRLAVGEPANAVGAEEFACHAARALARFSRSSARSPRAIGWSPGRNEEQQGPADERDRAGIGDARA